MSQIWLIFFVVLVSSCLTLCRYLYSSFYILLMGKRTHCMTPTI